jgi:hypothetical protein
VSKFAIPARARGVRLLRYGCCLHVQALAYSTAVAKLG